MSLMDILRRRQPRSFSNQLSEASLPTGEVIPTDMPELEALPIQAQQLALLAELMAAATPDVPERLAPARRPGSRRVKPAPAPASGRASRPAPVADAPETFSLTDQQRARLGRPLIATGDARDEAPFAMTELERELTGRPVLPRATARPLPRALKDAAPGRRDSDIALSANGRARTVGGGLSPLDKMLRDPQSQFRLTEAQRQINSMPASAVKDYALAAATVPVISKVAPLVAPYMRAGMDRLGQGAGNSIDALKRFFSRMGLAPDDADIPERLTGQLELPFTPPLGGLSRSATLVDEAAEAATQPMRGRQLDLPFEGRLADVQRSEADETAKLFQRLRSKSAPAPTPAPRRAPERPQPIEFSFDRGPTQLDLPDIDPRSVLGKRGYDFGEIGAADRMLLDPRMGTPRGQYELPFDEMLGAEGLAQPRLPFIGPEDFAPTLRAATGAGDDVARQLSLNFGRRPAAQPRAPRKTAEAVLAKPTPSAPPKKAAKAAPKTPTKNTEVVAAKKADAQATLRERSVQLLRDAMAKKKTQAASPTPPAKTETLEEFLARGGKITKVPLGASGKAAPPAPPPASGLSEQEALLQNVNFELGQREANRRARRNLTAIIAAILGGQSLRD